MSSSELSKERLRAALAEAGLTGTELADRLKVDERTARRWLSGGIPYPRHRQEIAEALGKEISDIWPELTAHPPAAERGGDLERAWPHWSDPRAPNPHELMSAASATIEFCGHNPSGLLATPGRPELLAAKARAGAGVRLIVAPLADFPPGDRNSAANSRSAGPGHAAASIAQAHRRLFALAEDTRVEVRQAPTSQCPAILRCDDQMLVALPLYGITRGGPLLHLQHRTNDGLFEAFCAHFQALWQAGQPLDGDPAAPPPSAGASYQQQGEQREPVRRAVLMPYGRRPPPRRRTAVAGGN